jgi:hypothetical protein
VQVWRRLTEGHIRTILGWQGSMEDGSVLRFAYLAQVEACYDPAPLQIHNQVSVSAGSIVHSDAVDLMVDCHPPVDPLKIAVSLSFKGTDEELQAIIDWRNNEAIGRHPDRLSAIAVNNIFVPGRQSYGLRIVAANSDTTPAYSVWWASFPAAA